MKLLNFLLLFLFSTTTFANIEELEQFEIRSYNPQVRGVKDLVFEVRVDGLTDLLSKNLALGKLIDVYYKVYWLSPSEFRIEVMGLPNGFAEVKDDLRNLIKGKLEFVLPENFSSKFKDYTLKVEPTIDGKLIKAIDATYTMAVPELNIYFDKDNKLKAIESMAPMSKVRTEFFHSPKAWSNNKLVTDKVVSKSGVEGNSLTVTNEIDYLALDGLGFPSKIQVKNVQEYTVLATKKGEKNKLLKKEQGSKIIFSKYEVNTGKAKRFIVDGILK